MNNELIFNSIENRNLFKTENIIGKNFNPEKYERVFEDKALLKLLNNQSINESVDAFIKGSLNLTTASTHSYVHRNTLIYRIGKIQKLIGINLKNYEDCVIYSNARLVYNMIKDCK